MKAKAVMPSAFFFQLHPEQWPPCHILRHVKSCVVHNVQDAWHVDAPGHQATTTEVGIFVATGLI
jgi:hypothetical protein